jgi:hypothetical protein
VFGVGHVQKARISVEEMWLDLPGVVAIMALTR